MDLILWRHAQAEDLPLDDEVLLAQRAAAGFVGLGHVLAVDQQLAGGGRFDHPILVMRFAHPPPPQSLLAHE